jgi:hypothetical protein
MSDIFFNCGACGKDLVVDQAGAGLTVNCPVCIAEIIIPPQSEPPPQQSTQPPQPRAVKECPFCKNNIPAAAVICVLCGQNVKTGGQG